MNTPVVPCVEAPGPAPLGSGASPTLGLAVSLGPEDLDAVMSIEPRAYPFPWSQGNVRDSLSAGHRARGLRDGEGRLLAYAIAMAGVGEWHLLNLTVAPEWQGRGLGQRLLEELVAHAVGDGSAQVWLEVRSSNERARRLYERHGFEAVGLRRRYYPAGPGRREDAVVMRRNLR